MKTNRAQPKVLFFDIETAPLLGYAWALFDQNIALNQIHSDWHVLSWAAKWAHDSEVMYLDQRNSGDISNDKAVLKGIWDLLDEADIVVTQNGKKFDVKKLNARFVIQGFKPPSSFRHIDTLEISKKHFGFTSNKLEYLSNALKTKHRKLSKRKFEGFELWKECLAGNPKAWREMEKYNRLDVLALEQVYKRLIPWDNTINFNIYTEGLVTQCKCGSTSFLKRGFFYTSTAKYQRYRCKKCGAETRDTVNLLTKEKKQSLRPKTSR